MLLKIKALLKNAFYLRDELEHIAGLGIFYCTSNFQQILIVTPTIPFFSFQYIFCKKLSLHFTGRHSKIGSELRKLTPALMFWHEQIAASYIRYSANTSSSDVIHVPIQGMVRSLFLVAPSKQEQAFINLIKAEQMLQSYRKWN